MRAEGFVEDGELADHLLVLLRFLEVCGDEALADELVDDAILPALDRIALLPGAPAAGEPPTLRGAYLGALAALALALRAGRPAAPPASELVEAEREWLRDRDSLGIERDWCGH